MGYATRITPGQTVDLAAIDSGATAGLEKEQGVAEFEALGAELRELQELLYGASHHSLLVVLQGMDTSGKDGAISHVFDFVNPQGCNVASFKVPTTVELAHDFLWRCHDDAPQRGQITIFNRSHYEDVLVVRVHDLAPEKVWRRRYEHINNFEALLAASNTIVVKFMLHISKKEQQERLIEREQDVSKAWKLSAGDWREREHWHAYQEAYTDALHHCSTEAAPWYVVPANKKWFRNLAIMETLVTTLRPLRQEWLDVLTKQGQQALEELQRYRAEKEQQATP